MKSCKPSKKSKKSKIKKLKKQIKICIFVHFLLVEYQNEPSNDETEEKREN